MAYRHDKARRRMTTLIICLVLFAVGTGIEQVAAHGWDNFIFRAPGVGASK